MLEASASPHLGLILMDSSANLGVRWLLSPPPTPYPGLFTGLCRAWVSIRKRRPFSCVRTQPCPSHTGGARSPCRQAGASVQCAPCTPRGRGPALTVGLSSGGRNTLRSGLLPSRVSHTTQRPTDPSPKGFFWCCAREGYLGDSVFLGN